jgi:hypothetical protein
VGEVDVQDEDIVIPPTVKGFRPGYLYIRGENLCLARGEVRVPAGKHVILTIRGVGATPARCRTALASLKADDLRGLEFFSLYPVDLSPDLVPLIVRLKELRSLSLGNVRVSPKDLALIALLPSLEELHPSIGLSDAGMAQIAKMQSLQRLNMTAPNRMTDKGLASLGQLESLEVLDLFGHPAMTDDGLKALTNLGSLQYLRLGPQGSFTDRGMEHLAALPSLKVLWLDTGHVTDEGLRHLSKSRSLERLDVYWLDKITDRGIAYLKDMPQFRGLDAGHAQLTDAALADLAAMPGVDWLELPAGFTDAGVRFLAKLDHLEFLRINETRESPLTDEALKAVCQIRSLKELSIGGRRFTDDGIGMLAGLANLETLHIERPGVDNETLKQLAKLPKLRTLRWTDQSDVTLSGLNALNGLAGLETLGTGEVYQDHKGLDLSHLRNLKTLAVGMHWQTTRVGAETIYTLDEFQNSDLACLSGLTELERLSLVGPGIGDEGLKHLASLTRLESLSVGGSPSLTDAGLRHLVNLHRLDSLLIHDSRITERGLAHLYPLKTLRTLRIATSVPISKQAMVRLGTELPRLQTLEFPQPEPTQTKTLPRPEMR